MFVFEKYFHIVHRGWKSKDTFILENYKNSNTSLKTLRNHFHHWIQHHEDWNLLHDFLVFHHFIERLALRALLEHPTLQLSSIFSFHVLEVQRENCEKEQEKYAKEKEREREREREWEYHSLKHLTSNNDTPSINRGRFLLPSFHSFRRIMFDSFDATRAWLWLWGNLFFFSRCKQTNWSLW